MNATPRPPHVVMTCGIAGAGKTTYALGLERQGYVRLSIDEEIWRRFGRYGIDYDAAQYAHHSVQAEAALQARLPELIEDAGGSWQLIYLKASPTLLRRRLDERRQRFDANAAFPITPTLLDAYLGAFEAPCDEGETIVDQDALQTE